MVRWRQVELVGLEVGGIAILDEETPGFLAGLSGVAVFELRVGNAAKVGIGSSRLGAKAETDQVNEPVTTVDLVAQHLPEVAAFGAEDVLPDRLVAEPGKDIRPPVGGQSATLG